MSHLPMANWTIPFWSPQILPMWLKTFILKWCGPFLSLSRLRGPALTLDIPVCLNVNVLVLVIQYDFSEDLDQRP